MPSQETQGGYRIVERIGAGGMGEVFRAVFTTTGGVEKTVAMKLVRPELASDDGFASLFVAEVGLAMLLSHANIVQAFDVGKIDGRWFMALEYVDGIDLAALLHRCRTRKITIDVGTALFIAIETLKGLDYAHRRRDSRGEPLGIVHRDISPGNLLISVEGEVKVTDFGIAKSAQAHRGGAQTIRGKLPYIAPEQLAGATVGREADVFGVGAVLFEVLTGRRAVEVAEGSRRRVFDDSQGVNDLPEELHPILSTALAEVPDDRYRTAAQMREALERYARDNRLHPSSTDLVDLLHEIHEPSSREPTEQPSPDDNPGTSEPHGGSGFDALLGRELAEIPTGGVPYRVLTAQVAVTTERSAPETAADSSHRGPTRSRWPVVGAVFAALLVATSFAAWFTIPSADTGTDTRTDDTFVQAEGAGAGDKEREDEAESPPTVARRETATPPEPVDRSHPPASPEGSTARETSNRAALSPSRARMRSNSEDRETQEPPD